MRTHPASSVQTGSVFRPRAEWRRLRKLELHRREPWHRWHGFELPAAAKARPQRLLPATSPAARRKPSKQQLGFSWTEISGQPTILRSGCLGEQRKALIPGPRLPGKKLVARTEIQLRFLVRAALRAPFLRPAEPFVRSEEHTS